ncbi:MAG: PQQ-dependent sugar dehydrogenase [Pseudomonadota bacterium]
MRKLKLLIAVLFSTSCFGLTSNLEVNGLSDVVWGMEFISETQMLTTLRSGEVVFINLKTGKKAKVSGGPTVSEGGQGGLLDLALHPNFANNNLVYFSYTYSPDGDKKTTALARATFDRKSKSFSNLQELFRAEPYYKKQIHFGSRIVFDKTGHLFLSVGDRGNRDYAQDLSRHNGKLLRLSETGEPAKGNPFENREGARKEIWSYGHRNPQGLVYDKVTDNIWMHEHGPRGGDEINLIQKGANYGWPIITYGREYYGPKIGEGITEKEGMLQPKKYYVPSIAPSGMALYRGPISSMQNSLFIGALALTHLNQVSLSKTKIEREQRHFADLAERVRDVKLSPTGKLYFSTDSGRIYSVSE